MVANATDAASKKHTIEDREHGKVATYRKHGCRCDACRIAHRDYAREYAKNGKKKHPQHGLTGYQTHGCRCDVCQQARKDWLAPRRKRIDDIKLASGCVDCGFNTHPECLDFDHVRGEKKYNVARMLNNSWDAVEIEIAKCEVVCANCHRLRTNKRRND